MSIKSGIMNSSTTWNLFAKRMFTELMVKFDAIQSTIFSRMSRRLQNTQIADYLHGHCLRFQDFAFSVEKANKSLFAPICIECGILPDSPYHQLMECTSFDSTYRSNIMEDLASYETNFHIPLLFNKINDMNMLSALRSVGIYGNADLFTDASVIRIISANKLNSFAVPALSLIRYFPKSLSWMNWSKIIISTYRLYLIQTVLNFGYQFWVFV